MATETTLTSYIHNPWDGTVFNTDQIKFDYSSLGFTPSASDSYKSTSGDIFKVYVGGVRIYRNSDSSYASGTGFMEDGDIAGSKLNGLTSIGGANVTWASTSDSVWYIDTANQVIYVDQSAIAATTLYGSSGKAVSFTSGSTIIELRRAVNDESGPSVDFSNASILTEQDLDNSSKNVFHMAQQAITTAEKGLLYNTGTNVFEAYQPGTTTKRRVTQVAAPTANDDAVTKTYLENTWLTPTDKTNSSTVAGISTEVATVAGDSTEVTTLVNGTDGTAGTGGTTKNIALVNTVATNIADVNAVAGKETEIGLLGTSAMAHATTGHLARLGTAAVVEDMGLLGTADCVADMALLGTADCVADMAILAGTSASGNSIVEDINTLATSDIVSDLNTLATSDIVSDMNALSATGVIDDLETCANNLATIQDFANKYRIAGSAPSSDNDDGDLYYNTATNQLNVHDGSSWSAIGLTQAQTQTEANNASVAMAIALG